MAKKEKEFNQKDTNKYLDNFLFTQPDLLEDNTIKTPRYKTNIVMFDLLLNGGLPAGKIIAIGAEPGVGKTTMLIQALGNIVDTYPDKKVYYLDVEGGATYELFQAMGYADLLYNPTTNPEGRFYLLSIETIQQIAAVIKKITEDPNTAAIAIDSETDVIDGLSLEDEELGTGNKAVGVNARMWSRSIGPIKAIIKKSNACLVIVHQARVDISKFKPVIKSTGGNAVKHAASVEIWGKKKGWIAQDFSIVTDKKLAIGALTLFTTEKNRLTKPFAAVMIPIFFGKGVSNKWAYKEWLEKHTFMDPVTGEVIPFINKKGSWFNISLPSGFTEKVQGDTKVWEIVNAHYEEIKSYVDSHGGFELIEADSDDDNPFNE